MAASNVHTLMDIVEDFIPIVDTAYSYLLANRRLYRFVLKAKMNTTATFFVQEAHRKLQDGDSRLALELFTRAITYADNESNKLSECYSQRANFLQGIDYWEEASEDIKRTFRCFLINVDSENFTQILRRSLDSKPRRQYTTPVRKLPKIPHYEMNQTFPCSTKNIRIVRCANNMGHRVLCTARLHISENIVVEKPLVIASGENDSILFCHMCMLFCVNPIPCLNCSKVAFCGEVCKASAWKQYHKYECYIQYITDRHKQFRLAVKIALSLHDYIDLGDDSHCPEGYRDILNRESSLEDISEETRNNFAFFTAQVFHGLKEHTTFFLDIANPFKFNIFKGLLMKIMLVVNEYRQEFVKTYSYHCGRTLMNFSISYIGIFPFVTHFRTGCDPNISINFCETSLVVKTLRVIQPGEELFIAGNYHYTITPKEERQAIFRSKYSSKCTCEACENNWPLGKDLQRIFNSNISYHLYMLSKRLDETLTLHVSVEHIHATGKDRMGVYLLGPSLEWHAWQTLLVKCHQRLCLNCETIVDFLRRKNVPIVS